MTDAVIDEIDGRLIRIGDDWLADFASCNYLGFDLEREIIEAVPAYLDRWGTHPSWSRLLGSPVLYEQIEERLARLLGAEDVLVLPTITLIHFSVIPVLAAGGSVFVDRRAHKTIYEGAELASLRGAKLCRFEHEDADDLERQLRAEPKFVASDLHRRRQQHDGQRTRPAACSPSWRGSTTRSSTWTTLTASAWSESAATASCRRTAHAGTASSAISARATTTSCSLPVSRSRTRRSPRSSPARRS